MGKDASHYYGLLSRAIRLRNRGVPRSLHFYPQLSGGRLLISRGAIAVLYLDVSSSRDLKNIYYLFKVYQYDISKWTDYLIKEGIPNIVQAVNTGDTPPSDQV